MHGFHPRDSKEESRQWRSDKMMEGERKKSGGQESKWWRQEKKTASLVRSNWLRCYKANKVITFSLCRTRASQTQAAVLNTYLSPDLNATKTCVIYLPPMNLYPSRSMIRYQGQGTGQQLWLAGAKWSCHLNWFWYDKLTVWVTQPVVTVFIYQHM